ncbi:hypothetical protein KC354_g13494 [Hortaea werneckii]|uniref:Large ribosomal subunit protein mL50 n=1 Tax=Hortaea werneckii TaxID=91943 RepID=A0A3M7CUT1_HORWE|nr:hypothetical protein KC354_g13494 [Hortaea werneckii]RMY55855.1 hypothetical protein D0863_13172 [Hortaea werneckii]
MRSVRTAEHALRLANSSSTTTAPSYVCRSCRAQAARQFHTSRPVLADEPWHKRMSNYFFGSKESRRADADREEKNKQRIQELADRGGSTQAEKKVDKFGRELDVAAIVDPSINKQYVQSMTWDGLERIGSEQWVRERADQGEQYVGFLPWKRVQLDAAQWQMLLHHVTVEALTLQKAGRDVEQVCWPRVGSAANWEVTRNARLQASVDGGVTVHFGTPEDESTILASIPTTLPENATQDQETLVNEVTNAVQGDLAEGEDGGNGKLPPAWMDISLHEPTLKMALIKRTLQLTSHRLSDHVLSTSATLADLWSHYAVPTTPAKLAHTKPLQKLATNPQIPNVTVHTRRQTPIDREKNVGRWKVIEEELVQRGLPVTGTRFRGAKVGIEKRGREVRIS